MNEKQIASCLAQHLRNEDHKYIEWLTSICYIAMVVHELAFQCPVADQQQAKTRVIEIFTSEQSVIIFAYKPVFPHEKPPRMEEIQLAHLLSSRIRGRLGENLDVFKKLLEQKWEAGIHQQQVYRMDVEGSVTNEVGIITGTAMGILAFDTFNKLKEPALELPAH